jgi:hypothetical protein
MEALLFAVDTAIVVNTSWIHFLLKQMLSSYSRIATVTCKNKYGYQSLPTSYIFHRYKTKALATII